MHAEGMLSIGIPMNLGGQHFPCFTHFDRNIKMKGFFSSSLADFFLSRKRKEEMHIHQE
jgi:hypothetical protein